MITSHYNYGCTIEVNSLIFMISINSTDELATKLVTDALPPSASTRQFTIGQPARRARKTHNASDGEETPENPRQGMASFDEKYAKAGLLKNSLAFAVRVRTIIKTVSISPGPLQCERWSRHL